MPSEQNTRNPTPRELVGSKDLREAFKDGNIRGSFFINGVEMHQFDANSPATAIAAINAKTTSHHVTAELDDQGHIVLTDFSGADIMLRDGQPWQEPPAMSTGDAAKDIAAEMKRQREQEKGDKPKTVLEGLGLPVTDKTGTQQGAPLPGFETGRSAEERKKAHDERRGMAPAQPQDPTNPTPGDSGESQGRLADGRGRTGTGGGSQESSAATISKATQDRNSKPAGQ